MNKFILFEDELINVDKIVRIRQFYSEKTMQIDFGNLLDSSYHSYDSIEEMKVTFQEILAAIDGN